MLDGKENLDLKTRVFKPKQLAGLVSYGIFLDARLRVGRKLKKEQMTESGGMIDAWVIKFLRFMVSFKGLSREEVTHALESLREETAGSKFVQGIV